MQCYETVFSNEFAQAVHRKSLTQTARLSRPSMIPCSEILILLAAYNGAAYLAEQIESIRRQSFTRWRLLVRDDGSSDGTPEVVRRWAGRDTRIELHTDGRGRLGVVGNFAALAEAALQTPAPYVAFADQDDVWHPEKLAWQLACMEAAQREAPAGTPIAVHSDLAVVDQALRPLHPSFLRYQGLWHEPDRPLRTLVVQNFVTGCTLLANRPLLKVAVPFPPEALVHDWWLALCAAAAGRLEFVPRATVFYRQHGGNAIGAKRWWSPRLWPKLRQLRTRGRSLRESVGQAEALRQRLLDLCQTIEGERFLKAYLQIWDDHAGAMRRVRQVDRLHVRRQGWLRNVIMFLQVCTVPKPVASAIPAMGKAHFHTSSNGIASNLDGR
jgi:glycosyltransferase involved in cell wall biosynthesis